MQIDAALARPLLTRACYLLAPRRDHAPNEKDQNLFRSVLLNKDMALLRFDFANAKQAEVGALLACVVAAEFAPARQKLVVSPANAPRVLDWLWRQGLYVQLSSSQQQAVLSTAQSWSRTTKEEFLRGFETLPAEFASLAQTASTPSISPNPVSSVPIALTSEVAPEQTPTPRSSASVSPDPHLLPMAPGRKPKAAARELLTQLGEALRDILSSDERLREDARTQQVAAESAQERAVAAERDLHRAEQAAREAETQRDDERARSLALEREMQEVRAEIERLRGEIDDARREHGREAETLAARAGVESARHVEAFKNSLADKLRLEWRDFGDVRDLPMTAELGESLRSQLRGVFSVLERAGLSFKS